MKKIKDIPRHELIGTTIEVVDAQNKSLIGIKGKIIDETRNMLILDGGKRIIKDKVRLKMKIDNKNIEIDGRILVGRPEDRIKKVRKIQW